MIDLPCDSTTMATLPADESFYESKIEFPNDCDWVKVQLEGGRAYAVSYRTSLDTEDGTAEVIARAPDVIVGSWCGKRFRPDRVAGRPGWNAVPAVRDGELHEIKSPLILQPGPAALTDGLDALVAIVDEWEARAAP